MITRIEINGFKTFSNFVMEFTPLTVIAGTNASGKSNIFDALNLISNLADKDLRAAFKDLRGDAEEQFTQFSAGSSANTISFAVEILVDKIVKDNWGESTTLKYTRMRYEIEVERVRNNRGFDDLRILHEKLVPLKHQEDKWILDNIDKEYLEYWRPKVKAGKRGIPYIFTLSGTDKKIIKIPLDGKPGPGREFSASEISQSALSSVNSVEFKHVLAAKNEMLSWRFLQLNPEDLRKPSSRMAPDTISHSGANLAAALYRLKMEDEAILDDIAMELNQLLPNFVKIDISEDLAENRFTIHLLSDDGRKFSSRVLSEGTLRILILCILKYDSQYKGTLCFEEPENGIHPFRLKMMTNLLKGLSTDFSEPDLLLPLRQIIVNTHSSGFVDGIIKTNYPEVSVWFSKLVSKSTPDKTKKYRITKLLPVMYSRGQLDIDFLEESEIKMTELELERYLDTKDFGT